MSLVSFLCGSWKISHYVCGLHYSSIGGHCSSVVTFIYKIMSYQPYVCISFVIP